jgi:hypothetical protein
MEIDFQGVDLDLWKMLVKKIQIANLIYPGESAIDRDYQRVADLLNDLFTQNFNQVPGLRNDFYLLARVYCLQTDKSPKGSGDPYVSWDESRDRFLFPEFTKYTRLCLGLTTKKLSEVPTGIDRQVVVEFFDFLFRNFHGDGFLPIVRGFPNDRNSIRPFFFNIRDGFDQIADFLEAEMRSLKPFSYDYWPEFWFIKFLTVSPVSGPDMVRIGFPCVWIDVDENLPDLEEKLEKYKIWPSIRVKTSPRGIHFFWVLRRPVGPQTYLIMDTQVKLAKLLGGDFGRCLWDRASRIPGMFNVQYAVPHFVNFETSAFEYDLSDFVKLPYGSLSLLGDYWLGVLKNH